MSKDLSFTIKLTDNSASILKFSDKALEEALYGIGITAVEGSVMAISDDTSPTYAVDTGRLRASISFITPNAEKKGQAEGVSKSALQAGDVIDGTAEPSTVIVGTNVEYAEFVHNGTSRMEGRPFITEGINKTKDKMQRIVEAKFKGETNGND